MSRVGSPISPGPLACAALLMLAACAQQPPAPMADAAAADPAPSQRTTPGDATPASSAVEPGVRAGVQALQAGLRAYDDGKYKLAEHRLRTALKAGLAASRDRAAAHKTLAFLYCTSERIKSCERAFRAARAADPHFALTKAEAGHPLWGPVYRRALGLR